jgi:hypothetical protein
MSDTLKKAMEKICPFRFSPGGYDCCCGISCMAWRWDDDGFERWYNYPTTKVSLAEEIGGKLSHVIEKYVFILPDGWEFFNPGDADRKEFWEGTTTLKRPWGENRKGFCGRCEPRIAEIEINS